MIPQHPDVNDNVETTSPLFLAMFMFVIAYQVWARQRGASFGLLRRAVVLYTTGIGFLELLKCFINIHPSIHLMISGTHFVWEWGILGYMFLDSRSSSVKGWLLDRAWMWILSKAVALAMAFPSSSWLRGTANSVTGDDWISHMLIAVILYRAAMCLRFWTTEAIILRDTQLSFMPNAHVGYQNCRMNGYQLEQRSWMSRLIA